MALKPRFIFKKLDSVLRGNIAAELAAQMKEMNCTKAIIVAGNPYFQRFPKEFSPLMLAADYDDPLAFQANQFFMILILIMLPDGPSGK